MALDVAFLEKALELPLRDRAQLARELILSLEEDEGEDEAEVQAAWATEIEERIARLERGETVALDWRESIARIRRSLAQRREQ